jgi:hypothetical protein
MYLSNNQLSSLTCFLDGMTAKVFPSLQDLTLENNMFTEIRESDLKSKFSMLSEC